MLNWNWNERVGTLEVEEYRKDHTDKNTYYLYQGNALLIVMAEWEEDGAERYTVRDFWTDKEHMKLCLGLVKGHNNIHDNWRKITFYKDKIRQRDLVTICSALVKAMPSITIEIKEHEGE